MSIHEIAVPKYLSHSEELVELWKNYKYAGILIISIDGEKVLLGRPNEAPELWGNFAGTREEIDFGPHETAIRESSEEIGKRLKIVQLGKPLIIKTPSNIGIVFPVQLDETTTFVKTEEIQEFRWFSRPEIADKFIEDDSDWAGDGLWGGVYTFSALQNWLVLSNGQSVMKDFGGVIEITSYPAFHHAFEYTRIKKEEKES